MSRRGPLSPRQSAVHRRLSLVPTSRHSPFTRSALARRAPTPRPATHGASLLAAAAAAAAVVCVAPERAAAQDTVPAGVSVRLRYDAGARPGLAVLPVRGDNGDSLRAILARDLDYGDRVTLATNVAGLVDAAGRVNYDAAARAGVAGVVEAGTTHAGAIRLTLHDVARRRVALVREVPLATPVLGPDWRLGVHAAGDEVERWATGVPGVAATRVLFIRDRRVWSVDSDGENAHPLTDRGALSPAWHPTGRAFVHSTLSDRGEQQIVARPYTALAPGGGAAGAARVLASQPVTNLTPNVSRDGSTVVFAHGVEDGSDLYTVPFDGGAARRVTVGRGSDNVSPAWGPDGRRVAFTSGRTGHPEVYIADADGTNAELLTEFDPGSQNYRSNPDWSPDGRLVAFQALVGGQFQVMTVEVRGRGVKRLTAEGRNEDPSWAPDARHVVVTSTRTGSSQLFVVDAETGRARQLTRGGAGARMAAWSPALR